jgi:hypothetical protein
LSLELVFRQIPGQSIQRRRMPRLRPLPFRQRRPFLQSVRNRVPRVEQPPRRLRLRTPLPLAFLRRARPLPLPDPWVGPEPFSTKPAWPLIEPRAHRGHAHRNPRVPPPPPLAPRSPRGWTTSGEQTRTTSQERLRAGLLCPRDSRADRLAENASGHRLGGSGDLNRVWAVLVSFERVTTTPLSCVHGG